MSTNPTPGSFLPPVPPPPKKRRRWPWIALVVLVALCGFGGCVAALSSGGSKTTGTSVTATGAPGAPAGATTKAAPAGPKGFALGATGTVTRDGADAATVTIAEARTAKDYQGRPAIVLTVTVTALPSLTGTYSFNTFDFDARAKDGTTLDLAVLDNGPAELHSGDLAAGQSAKGAIMFVLGSAPASGVTVTYRPGFQTLAFWTVP